MRNETRPLRAAVWPAMLLPILTMPTAASGQAAWDGHDIRIEAAESRVEEYMGRRALLVRDGTVWLDHVDLRNGVVEFDLAVSGELGFHGLAFRARDDENFEHIYVRPHLSGRPDATQYTPVFNGVTGWQIYAGPRYAQPVEIPTDRWVRVRVAVRDRRAELSVDGRRLVFPELVRPVSGGAVGLTASISPARFANIVVRSDTVPTLAGGSAGEPPPEVVPPGTVTRWRVSTPFAESRLSVRRELEPDEWGGLRWDVLDAGERGIANLAILRRREPERNTVFAAVTLRAPEAALVPVRFGFSDRVVVYLNGRPLFRGDDGWRARDYRFLGTVGLFYELALPLDPGENELWLAVSEDFGGWGVTLQMPDSAGVAVVPARPTS